MTDFRIHVRIIIIPFIPILISRKNINCSIDESLERFKVVTEAAAAHGIPVRGYDIKYMTCSEKIK